MELVEARGCWSTRHTAPVVRPGHWFEQADRYMRIGYVWPAPPEFSEGLDNISPALAGAR